MLPRVAFEYGQTVCASATSFSAVARSTPAMPTVSTTDRKKPESSLLNVTALSTVTPWCFTLCWPATNSTAPPKHAA